MNPRLNLLAFAGLGAVALGCWTVAWSQGAAARVELRQPGFLFLELETQHLDEYETFFQAVMGFQTTYRQGRFLTMETARGQLLLLHPDELPAGHPFHGKYKGSDQGQGVEIGLVVADLDHAFAEASKHKAWRISSGIARRPWGVRDFRILAPDGYYLRFTEGPK